ncbi:GNAT family N-acetyltransferase [Corynebacterium sp. Marseille-Q2516]
MSVTYTAAPLAELSPIDVHNLYKLRVDVYVAEQATPYAEIDDTDAHPDTLHLRSLNSDGRLIGCARLFPPPGRDDDIHFGRLVIAADARHAGLGSDMVRYALEVVRERFPGRGVTLEAMATLQDFYRALGFHVSGEEYLDTGVAHIPMTRREV